MRKIKHLYIFVIFSFLLTSCAPKLIEPGMPPSDRASNKLFAKAEKKLHAKKYDIALDLYMDYISLYPEKPLAPAAFLKIGDIYLIKGNYKAARMSYQKLIDEYPECYFVPDASIDILATYYDEKKYEELLTHAAKIDDSLIADDFIVRKYIVVGDAYLAMGLPNDAYRSFDLAYSRSTEQEKNTILIKLKEAMGKLSNKNLIAIIEKEKDSILKIHLKYHLALYYMEKEKYEDALLSLSAFIEEFPDHELSLRAARLINEINQKTDYARYTIGCLLPLTGRYKAFGDRALRGIELAHWEFTKKSKNRAVEIIVKDTGADPDKTAAAIKELVDLKVAAIVGPMITAEQAAHEAQERKIPIVTLSQKNDITQIGNYVFRNFLTPKMQAEAISDYAVNQLGLKRFAILYPDEKYGETFLNCFWDAILSRGGELIGAESYSTDQTDFARPIKKLTGLYYDIPDDLKDIKPYYNGDPNTAAGKPDANSIPNPLADIFTGTAFAEGLDDADSAGENPDDLDIIDDIVTLNGMAGSKAIVDFEAIFIPDSPEKVGLILPQLSFYDVEGIYLLGTNLWHSPKLISMAAQHIQGAIIPEAFVADSRSKKVKKFVGSFKKIYGKEPGFIEAVSYETAIILFNMICRDDIRFQASIKNELAGLKNFPGITGPVSFDENGEADRKLFILKVRRNKFVETNR